MPRAGLRTLQRTSYCVITLSYGSGGAGRGLAVESFLTAAELYDELPCPYEAAQATEQAALAMFETGDGRAEETLRAALSAYRELGATWDHARCSRAARGHGVTLAVSYRRGRKGYGKALSPREQQVAELAAEGRSNQEIADELLLSVFTIKKQLSAAMRKLGAESRAALAHRLPAGQIWTGTSNTGGSSGGSTP